MNVLVFNCGSSSLKYRLIAMPDEQELSGGESQRIGPPTAKPSCLVLQRHAGEKETRAVTMRNHAQALREVGRAQAILFTDTIGETVPEVREAVCSGLRTFGVCIDAERNAAPGPLPVDVATPDSRVRIWVVATNEEISIARSTYRAVCA